MSNYKVVSFYTETYTNEANQLKKTLELFGIPYHLELLPTLGDWQKNTQHKPIFLLNMLDKWKMPVIWVDADARFRKYPALFKKLDCDVAAHIGVSDNGHEWLNSAVVYFNNNEVARDILDKWIIENDNSPRVWDQDNLNTILNSIDHRFQWLPHEYCFIFDIYRKLYPAKEPVIEQMQASRRLK